MSTIIPFIPSNIIAPSFHADLDGDTYLVTVTWNISALRYYINIYDQNGNWIITTPLVSTPPARPVKSAVFDPFLNNVTVEMVSPELWPVPLSPAGLATPLGTFIDYTLAGFTPDTYNGTFRAMTVDEVTFTFPMSANPGYVTVNGTVNRYMNMIGTIFKTSTLIYRNNAFEVNP